MVKISNEVKVVKINICVRVFRVDYLLCNPCTMKKKSKLDIKLLSSRNYKTQNELCTITEQLISSSIDLPTSLNNKSVKMSYAHPLNMDI